MRVLITGITGFVGSHLAEYLLAEGHEVHGTARWRSSRENIAAVAGKVALHECDLRDAGATRRAVAISGPELVFHLAAQSYVPASWIIPVETMSANVLGQVNLLEALRAEAPKARIQIAGSSEEYGLVHEEEAPITEDNPLRPLSPYGVSKVAQDLMGFQYFRSYGMHIVRTRAFNHEGPRRGEVFVTSNFAKQVAEIETGKREYLSVGNLKARRDFTDVRDVVRAYFLALKSGEAGAVYNIGSGRLWRIEEIAGILRGFSSVPFDVREDPTRMRPSDVEFLLCDPRRFRDATGWEPNIPFETTLKDTLDYWRQRVNTGA